MIRRPAPRSTVPTWGPLPRPAAPDLARPSPDLAGCKTTCGGAECGPIPDGCGGTVDCGDCGGAPGDTCISYPTPLFQQAVRNAIKQVETDHPEYFDITNPMGE